MRLIDTHTHIYLSAFDHDRATMIQRARDTGVERFYLPGIDSDSIAPMLDLEKAYPGECFAMMGLHPCSVNKTYKEELSIVDEWLKARPFAAVGEIGLDMYWDTTFATEQFEAFRIQIEWALQYDLPIVIHTRNAMQPTIDVVNEYKGRGLRGIFHCFGDSREMAEQILDAGFLLGIGGVVTYKNSGLDQVLEYVPIDRVVLETDAPYLTPAPFRGKRNESSYLQYVVEKLANVYGMDAEEIGEVTSRNALGLYAQ